MIAENVKKIRERITAACVEAGRKPDSVTLVAVSKTFGAERIKEAVDAGVLDVAENYVQELLEKRECVPDPRVRWHFIGHLQSNKVRFIADWISVIHSVDNTRVAEEIEKRAAKLDRKIHVFIEVNTSGEITKFGVTPEKAADLAKNIAAHSHLKVEGLMTVGPFSEDPAGSRRSFRLLRETFDKLNSAKILPEPMVHLSMGMSHDFPAAIAEGATMVRIGTAIFGSRPKPIAH